MVGVPIIDFEGGSVGTVSSASPYTLTNPSVGDAYNFTLAVTNIAGKATRTIPIKGKYLVCCIT